MGIDRRSFIAGAASSGALVAIMGQSGDPGCEPPPTTTTTTTAPTTTTTEAPTTTTTTAPPGPGADRVFSGETSLPGGFTVPAGETWAFDPNVSTTVRVRANVIVNGRLQLRPAAPGVIHALIFEGVSESAYVGGGHTPLASDIGLWITGAGVLDAVGAHKTCWSTASGALAAGATSITVADATGWQVGDEVWVTATARPNVSSYWDRHDRRVITAVDGNTITVAGLTNAHPAVTLPNGTVRTAEVVNLTRNVRIMGTAVGRAHIGQFRGTAPQHISDVELAYLGPRKNGNGVLGRYPLHIHECNDATRGSHITSVVGHDLGHRGFVPHASHGVTFTDCAIVDTWDAAYWWDQAPNNTTPAPATHDCVWQRCLLARVREEPAFRAYRLGGFVLGRGNGNKMIDCTVSGVIANTGNVNDEAYADSSGIQWPEELESEEGVWEFHGNVAHNCQGSGVFTWQNTPLLHVVSDQVVYHCSTGLNHGAYVNRYLYERWQIKDCNEGIRMHALGWGTTPPMILRNFDIDLGGLGQQAVRFVKHTLNGTEIRFEGFKVRGYTARGVADLWTTDGGSVRTRAVFVGTDWAPTLPHIYAPNGTSIREA